MTFLKRQSKTDNTGILQQQKKQKLMPGLLIIKSLNNKSHKLTVNTF